MLCSLRHASPAVHESPRLRPHWHLETELRWEQLHETLLVERQRNVVNRRAVVHVDHLKNIIFPNIILRTFRSKVLPGREARGKSLRSSPWLIRRRASRSCRQSNRERFRVLWVLWLKPEWVSSCVLPSRWAEERDSRGLSKSSPGQRGTGTAERPQRTACLKKYF